MPEKINVNSLVFVDKLRELSIERDKLLSEVNSLLATVKEENVKATSFAKSAHNKESIEMAATHFENVSSALSKISLRLKKIQDIEDILVQILELYCADGKLSFKVQRKVDGIGNIYDRQGELFLTPDVAYNSTQVSLTDLMVATNIKNFFEIPASDINFS